MHLSQRYQLAEKHEPSAGGDPPADRLLHLKLLTFHGSIAFCVPTKRENTPELKHRHLHLRVSSTVPVVLCRPNTLYPPVALMRLMSLNTVACRTGMVSVVATV